jgi:hypothetical protein
MTAEPLKATELPSVDRYLDAPVIYFDAVPTAGIRAGVMGMTLALHVGETISTTNTTDHVVAVANLRFSLLAATQMRVLIDKLLLAAAPTPGAAN